MAKRVLITGCSTGIGRALAVELAARGHAVIATARRAEMLDGMDVAMKLQLDVCDSASIADAVSLCGDVDVLVNNAGYSLWGVAEAVDDEALHRLFETNFFGAMRMVRAILPGMRERRRGTIFQVSSAAATLTSAMLGPYGASKAALEAVSVALRMELAPFGIAICNVILGAIETDVAKNRQHCEMQAYARVQSGAQARSASLRKAPVSPEHVARHLAEAIEMDRPPMRIDGGEGALARVRARQALADEAWESSGLAELYGPDWKEQLGL